jgi:hypothetical protein
MTFIAPLLFLLLMSTSYPSVAFPFFHNTHKDAEMSQHTETHHDEELIKETTVKEESHGTLRMNTSEELSDEEREQLGKELKQVLKLTKLLKTQVQEDRLRVAEIIERTKIHQDIVKRMNAPKKYVDPQVVGVDQLLRNEKIRLIAEQSRRSQKQLQVMKKRQALKPIKTPAI